MLDPQFYTVYGKMDALQHESELLREKVQVLQRERDKAYEQVEIFSQEIMTTLKTMDEVCARQVEVMFEYKDI
jgi:hypothetical protein